MKRQPVYSKGRSPLLVFGSTAYGYLPSSEGDAPPSLIHRRGSQLPRPHEFPVSLAAA